MGRSRRRQRRNGNGNGHMAEPARTMETLAPVYVPVAPVRPPAVAPVLELDGLDPFTEIRGPALALADEALPDAAAPVFDDPAQLLLEPFDLAAAAALEAAVAESAAPAVEAPGFAPDGADAPGGAVATLEPEPVASPPPDPVEFLYEEARSAAAEGRPDEAKRLYRRILAERASHVRARNNLALLLDAEGNHQGALAELDRALDTDPENGQLLVNRGALLGAMGRYAAAERDLRKVLRVEPANAEALFNLGVTMTKKGLWCEAIPNLRRVVELEPDRGAAHYYLGEALNHVDDLGGALSSYQRAAELQPGNPRALYGLGIIYDRLARPDDAALMYRRAREAGRR